MNVLDRISDIKADAAFKTLRAKKIGLVLAGGGAKGAYQIGCLECLNDLGLNQFHAICGVSVGALNGVAAALGRIPEGVKLWEGIAFKQVFKTSPTFLFAIIRYLAGGILIINDRRIGLYVCLALVLLTIPASLILHSFLPLILGFGFIYFFVFRGQRMGKLIYAIGNVLVRSTHAAASLSDQSRLRNLLEKFFFTSDRNIDVSCQTFLVVARDGYWFDPDFPTFRIEAPPPGDPDIHYAIDKPILRHGWIPQYIPVHGLTKEDILKQALESAALPVVFRHTRKDYGLCTDGGMADNIPLNKILDTKCDYVFVVQTNRELASIDKLVAHVKNIRRSIKLESYARKHGRASLETNALYKRYREWLRVKLTLFKNHPELDQKDYRNKAYPTEPGLFQAFDFIDFLIPLIGKHNVIGAEYYNHNEALNWRLFHSWDLLHTGKPELVPYDSLEDLPTIINVIPSTPLGNILTGTLAFRASKAKKLVELGYLDMLASIEAQLCA